MAAPYSVISTKRLYLGPDSYWDLQDDTDLDELWETVDAAMRGPHVFTFEAEVSGVKSTVQVNGARLTSFTLVDKHFGTAPPSARSRRRGHRPAR